MSASTAAGWAGVGSHPATGSDRVEPSLLAVAITLHAVRGRSWAGSQTGRWWHGVAGGAAASAAHTASSLPLWPCST